MQVHLGDTPHNLNESDFEYLASRTEGFSGSDISVCVSFNFIMNYLVFISFYFDEFKVKCFLSSLGEGCFI